MQIVINTPFTYKGQLYQRGEPIVDDETGQALVDAGLASFKVPQLTRSATLVQNNNDVVGVESDNSVLYFSDTNYVTQRRKLLYSGQNGIASGVVHVGGGGAFTGSISVEKSFSRTGNQCLKMFCSTNGSSLIFSPPSEQIRFIDYGTIGIWFYLERVASAGMILTFSKDTDGSFTNRIAYSFGNDQMKIGWNCLTINTAEDGTTSPSSDGRSWTVNGAMATSDIVNAIRLYVSVSQNEVNPIYIDSVYYQEKSKAKVIIGFDAGTDPSKVQYALPIMKQYGFKGYLAADGDQMATFTLNAGGNYDVTPLATVATAIQPLYNNGWDVIQQGLLHISYALNNTNTALLTTDFDAGKAIMTALGFTRSLDYFAYPNSSSNPATNAILIEKGVKWARSGVRKNVPTTEYGVDQLVNVGSFDFGNQTLTTLKQRVDSAILYGETVVLYSHTLVVGGNGTSTTGNALTFFVNDFSDFIDYVKTKVDAGLIDVVTPTEWMENISADFNVTNPNPIVALAQTATPTPIMTGKASRFIGTKLFANITIGAPWTEGLKVGEEFTYTFLQDATGGRTITWNAAFVGVTLAASGTANQKAIIKFTFDGTVFIQTSVVAWYS